MVKGVIDLFSERKIGGWAQSESTSDFEISLEIGDRKYPASMKPRASGGVHFSITHDEKISLSDIDAGRAIVWFRSEGKSAAIKLWHPLQLASDLEKLPGKQLEKVVRTLGEPTRNMLYAEMKAHLFGWTTKKRALFATASFQAIAGSEPVIQELGEELIARGWSCDITAWNIQNPMADLATKAGIKLLKKPKEVNPLDYDLVWVQNRLEPVFDYEKSEVEADRTLFVFAHLDNN